MPESNEQSKPALAGVASADLLAVIDDKIKEIAYKKKKEYQNANEAQMRGQQLEEIEFELKGMRGEIEEILIG